MAAKRPNFIVIMTDQHRADYLGCAGHPVLKTPAIDSLAKRGTRFTRFYVASPVCMPNRGTYMTGRMPSVSGARGNGVSLSLQANTFVDLLRTKGWRTALVGKSHLMNMQDNGALWKPKAPEGLEPPGAGFEEALKPWVPQTDYEQEIDGRWEKNPDWKLKLPFYGFERVHLCTGHGDRVSGQYVHWLAEKGVDRAKMVGRNNALPSDVTVPQAWRTRMPEEFYPTSYIRDHAVQVLDEWAGDKARGDDPFFMMVSFPDPHHPFTPPGKYWDMYKPEQAVLPKSFHAPRSNGDGAVQRAQRTADSPNFDREHAMAMLPVNEREAKEAIALTYGMIAMIDDSIGVILKKLDDLGLREDTVILFTADHGDFLGDHGLMLKGPLHLESIIKVPFIWADPAGRQGVTCDALAGTIDIPTSVLARAGLAGFHGMQGRSILGEVADGADHGPGVQIVEEESQRTVLDLPGPVRVRSMVTDEWRITVYADAQLAELYNLKRDPDQLENLWDNPAAQVIKTELLAQMVRRSIDLVDWSPAPTRRA